MIKVKHRHETAVVTIWSGSTIAALVGGIALLARGPGNSQGTLTPVLALLCTALVLLIGLSFYRLRVLQLRTALAEDAQQARHRTNELFVMTEMLQSAEGYEDAAAVLQATSTRLLPAFGGALYIFNNSRDRLDLAGSWNMPEGVTAEDPLTPNDCWALKRGKFHLNDPQSHTLCCNHHTPACSAIEVPMIARGAVYGLFVLFMDHPDAFDRLRGVQRLARALADSMSLALSNIALREKLRTQSLRDPLTGLYNRRYMEDALERYINLAERKGASTAVIMIDLDHFKMLNDRLGHAKGDAVLRDVASQLVGGLRPSDVVCRYGGEELLVILPECSIEDARIRAEALRARVESLSEVHDAPISASFGVAAIPETSSSVHDVMPMADAALYAAKQQGRNRVICAARRGGAADFHPVLVAAE